MFTEEMISGIKADLETKQFEEHLDRMRKEHEFVAAGGILTKPGETRLSPLSCVRIEGVKSRPLLNGTIGTLLRRRAKGRWAVQLGVRDKEAEVLSLKAECLTFVGDEELDEGHYDAMLAMAFKINPLPEINVGSTVLINGVEFKPKLNGARGRVLGKTKTWSAGKDDRWSVELASGKVEPLSATHLTVVPHDTFVKSKTTSRAYRPCTNCNLEAKTETCKGCGKVHYCSKECQEEDWNCLHKLLCKGSTRRSKAEKMLLEAMTKGFSVEKGKTMECPITAKIENAYASFRQLSEVAQADPTNPCFDMFSTSAEGIWDVDEQILKAIAKNRYLCAVSNEYSCLEYCYSIGNASRGDIPVELITFRKDQGVVSRTLNRVGRLYQQSAIPVGDDTIYLEKMVGNPGREAPKTHPNKQSLHCNASKRSKPALQTK